MKTIVQLAVALVCLGFVSQGNAQSPHPMTWTPRNAAPGTQVNIAGTSFVLVRVPVENLGVPATRYAVSFLAPRVQGFLSGSLTTVHSTAPLNNPIEIDGFDAKVSVSDGRTYTIGSGFQNPSQYNFTVEAQVTCAVTVKVGATLLQFFAPFTDRQQPVTNIGPVPDALQEAEWDDYIHPTAQVRGCDIWLDYIKIRRVN